MGSHWRYYLSSFSFPRAFWLTLGIDVLFFGFLFLTFSQFTAYLEKKSVEAMGGLSLEQIQQLLATSPEQAISIYSQVQGFMILALGGMLALILTSFLLLSLAQAGIWNVLLEKKLSRKSYWRWNALHLVLLIPLALYGLLFAMVKLIVAAPVSKLVMGNVLFSSRHPALAEAIVSITDNVLNLLGLLLTLLLLFLIYYSFARRYQVWASVGDGFSLLKTKWAHLWRMLLLSAGTALLLTLLLVPVQRTLFLYPPWDVAANFAVALLFLSWFRCYVVRAVHEP